MSGYKLVTQYTEDAYAREDRICDRPACRANIRTGDPCFYVATIDPGQPGRHVCASCYSHYQKKAATSVRPTGKQHQLANQLLAYVCSGIQAPSEQSSMLSAAQHRVLPDPCTIQQAVNAAQRKCKQNMHQYRS